MASACQKTRPNTPDSCIIEETGVFCMEKWRKDARREAVIVDLDMLVPKNHLLRKIEKVMDYDWLYERLEGYYCHTNGRPGTDPVVLIKMVLLQHLFGIPSLRRAAGLFCAVRAAPKWRAWPGMPVPPLPCSSFRSLPASDSADRTSAAHPQCSPGLAEPRRSCPRR